MSTFLCMGLNIMQTYAIAFNSACALSIITDLGCQCGWTSQQRALSFLSHDRMSFSLDLPTMTKAIGIPFSHSSNTITIYKRYYKQKI